MFREAFEKLDPEQTEKILNKVNPLIEGYDFDSSQTSVMSHDLSFYKGYKFYDIADLTVNPIFRRYAIIGKNEAVILDWSNVPLFALNAKVPISLNRDNVYEYARFFFTYVKGQYGRFLITESVEDINWKEEPPPAAKKAIGQMISPLQLLADESEGTYILESRVMFRDSLFKAIITVKPNGDITIGNEELLIEEMPVIDETLMQ